MNEYLTIRDIASALAIATIFGVLVPIGVGFIVMIWMMIT